MKKYVLWILWITVSAALIFGGWAMKDFPDYLVASKFLMSFGWLLAGTLIVLAAVKTLK